MKKITLIILLVIMLLVLTGCQTAREKETNKPVDTEATTVTELEEKNEVKNEPNYTEIKVSTPKDLLENIKPYTRFILTETMYNLSSIPSPITNEWVETDDWFIGNEYTIHDVDHIEIVAEKAPTTLVVSSGHVNVLNFKKCHDIKLSGLTLGHEVEKGTCFGGVLHLEDCQNITVDDCHLYGCGTYGIIANDTSHVTVTNSEIYDCTEGILELHSCNDFSFEDSSFHNNQEYSGFVLENCHRFTLKNCDVYENLCKEYTSLFSTYSCSDIILEHCTFKDNTYPAFGDKEAYTMTNCTVEDENFDEPVYYDVEPDFEGN